MNSEDITRHETLCGYIYMKHLVQSKQSRRDGSISKVPAVQAQGSEFESPHPTCL